MSEPRSRSRATPRRNSGAPRTAPRRPDQPVAPSAPVEPSPAAAATATLEPPEVDVRVEQEVATSPSGPRAGRRDRRSQRPRAPRHRLLLVSTAVLALGLLGVLLLNTIISQGAFRQHELEIDLILTAEQEESLARAVQQAETPIEVEKKARALGMVPAAAPVFLRLSDGRILGDPVPAPAPTGAVSFKDAPGIQPTPKPRLAGTTAESDPTADPMATDGATDATQDPSSLVDPALDPSTGLVDPTPSPEPSATSAAAPSPAPTTQDVNP